MSLDRVISEQQKRIDDLLEGNKKLIERAANVFKRNEELFEAMACLLDYDFPTSLIDAMSSDEWSKFSSLKHEVRMQMIDAGYCLHCREFVCQCDELD